MDIADARLSAYHVSMSWTCEHVLEIDMDIVKMLSDGQITIPQAIREKAHIRPGDSVQVDVDEAGDIHLCRLHTFTFAMMFEQDLVDLPVRWESLVEEAERAEAERVVRAAGLEPRDD
jgi:AbrB family looped-hinge helix DNA binding protein